MVPPPAHAHRHFLPWDRPWLPQVVSWLAADWSGEGPLDLSRILAIVPTRQSGRRLREALAVHASEKKQAVFPPRVLTPETLVALQLDSGVASRVETLLAWVEVFCTVDLARFREVFPVDPPTQNFAWAWRLAQSFARLQATLAENALSLGEVSSRLDLDFPEYERWRQIGELDRRYEAKLAQHSLMSPHQARIAAAQNPKSIEGVDRVVLLGTPDPLRLALRYLAAEVAAPRLDIVVFAPEDEANAFDGWGRPRPEVWEKRILQLPDFYERVHLGADPAAQAESIVRLAQLYEQPTGVLALGVADPEVLPLLSSALSRGNLPVYNPEGRSRRQEALFHLLAALAELVREDSFRAVEELARCPDFFAMLNARLGPKFSLAKWLGELDGLRASHLPSDLAAARRYAPAGSLLGDGLSAIEQLRVDLISGDFATGAASALAMLFSARNLDLADDYDARLADAASGWTEVVRECAEASARFPRLTVAEWWELAVRLYGEGFATEEKTPNALELQGWLELLWEDSPHLAVAGLNDGRVPDSVSGDVFLPESLRVRLGLKTNEARFARDAYMLQAITACRPRVDYFLGKTTAVGEPLRPSRLLLRCLDSELPQRVAFLFGEPLSLRRNFPWRRAWTLKPRLSAALTRIRVTALRDYLQCPFRFYLRHVLGMSDVDAQKSEMDAMDFGSLCHVALEQLGLNPVLRESTDPAVLRQAMWDTLDTAVHARFGRDLTLPLVVQCESARQRLAKAAEVQARERAAGWVIEAVEQPFEMELGGLLVRGRIDRIERHDATGARRVVDYKTTDVATAPMTAHFRPVRDGEPAPPWAVIQIEGKMRVWSDLQLPLYRHALAATSVEPVSSGYFNLPKATGQTGIEVWNDRSDELQAAALACAVAACEAIRAGKFWPPNEALSSERDRFGALFHQGVAASIGGPVTR